MAQIKDLIVNGVGRFIGKLYASEFIGKLTGNADTATSATKATQDESGNNIKSSYASSISISDHTITLKNKNGTSLGTVTVPDNNTDTKVTQTVTTSNASYPLLLAPNGQTATTTTTSYFDSGVTLNPSTNTIVANISGNAATASKLATARSITFTGSVTGSGTFDGSGNLSIATTTNHTHNYAGSSSAGGSATSAVKLDSSAGSATQPVYFSGGKPVVCTYTLGKSVPSNAVFTDTAAGKTFTTASTITSLGWTSNDVDVNRIPSISTLAYWNGAYANTASNLAYCKHGAFGTASTASKEDFAAAGHTHSAMTGATASAAGTAGLVPAPAAGKQTSFLRGDGTWVVPTDTDTHYTSHLYVGASGGNANATTATSNPYLLCVDNTTNRNSVQLKAGSNMSISAVNGVVTFSSSYTNTTYGVATSSVLGLVKSGTDITVDSSGNVSVNDNSHAHTIGNISGLQSILNGKASTSHTHSYLPLSGGTLTGTLAVEDNVHSGVSTSTSANGFYIKDASDTARTAVTYNPSTGAYYVASGGCVDANGTAISTTVQIGHNQTKSVTAKGKFTADNYITGTKSFTLSGAGATASVSLTSTELGFTPSANTKIIATVRSQNSTTFRCGVSVKYIKPNMVVYLGGVSGNIPAGSHYLDYVVIGK